MAIFAVQAVSVASKVFCKFLAANDTGRTGANQDGIYIPKVVCASMFNLDMQQGGIVDRWVQIEWLDSIQTKSRIVYYTSKNECRITNFGRGFPFLQAEFTGALLVMMQCDADYYKAYILNNDDDITFFLDAFGLSPTNTNFMIHTDVVTVETREKLAITEFVAGLHVDFPSSEAMSIASQQIQDSVYNHAEYVRTDPDNKLIDWISMEFRLFRAIEQSRYGTIINNGFRSVDDFINTANQVLNRRKSRAGKSLENHLSAIFDRNGIRYTAQATTEGSKRPDFLFPSETAYHDFGFPTEKLISLAAKTTCKDRWRQVINEASRLRDKPKYLCTLQQGISSVQMDEMQDERIVLVVPKPYIKTYPQEYRNRIWTVTKFVQYIQEMENA